MNDKSKQEKLMHLFCGRLMAAPFVFFPELWKIRHNKKREPADLMWVCNNCIILMYMQEKRDETKFSEAAEHNIIQANRSINLWKNNPIEGKNEWHRFFLPFGKSSRIVVLSIAKAGSDLSGNSYIEIH